VFEIQRLAPECGHRIKVDTVNQNAVNDERHPVILAATTAMLTSIAPQVPIEDRANAARAGASAVLQSHRMGMISSGGDRLIRNEGRPAIWVLLVERGISEGSPFCQAQLRQLV